MRDVRKAFLNAPTGQPRNDLKDQNCFNLKRLLIYEVVQLTRHDKAHVRKIWRKSTNTLHKKTRHSFTLYFGRERQRRIQTFLNTINDQTNVNILSIIPNYYILYGDTEEYFFRNEGSRHCRLSWNAGVHSNGLSNYWMYIGRILCSFPQT